MADLFNWREQKEKDHKNINSKDELESVFNSIMNNTYEDLHNRQMQDFGENLVKTYLFECYNQKEKNQEKIRNSFNQLNDNDKFEVNELDNGFFSVKDIEKEATFYLENIDNRFIKGHSADKADDCREGVKKIIKETSIFDRAWFSSKLLENLSYIGNFESWKSSFDSKGVYTEKEIREEKLDWEELRISMKSRNPRKYLEEMRKTNIFQNNLPLTGIKISNGDIEDDFAREEVNFKGKFTARGNNFPKHNKVVDSFYEKYSKLICFIEDEFGFDYSGQRIDGKPLIINYKEIDEESFETTVKNWFKGKKPFRLWGDVDFEYDDFVKIKAVDLHTGHKLNFEIGLDFMRVYLPAASCGNTIARLITNLEQHFASSIEVSSQKFKDILAKDKLNE
jgi:hypothetical protein